jgi:N-methylhydantoinase B/oxoprolinase/acetone carboxylase alpha subunit
MEIGKVYKLDNELIRLEKIHKNGIHVFKVVDQFGNDVVKRKGNVIIYYGDRIVRKRLDQVQDVDGSEFKQLNLF